jgi:alpha-tubulin suppressor-like RCC1 family protein
MRQGLSLLVVGLLLGILTPAPAVAQSSLRLDPNHHVVLFLNGINSTGEATAADFGNIRQRLIAQGLTDDNFSYFSYSAARPGVTDQCQAWDQQCTPEGALSTLSATPVYDSADTHLDLTRQAAVLDWLVNQLVQRDPMVRIDFVGFSLGGIVTSYWAATNPPSITRGHVHTITLIESPVGGIPLATAAIAPCDPSPCEDGAALFKGAMQDRFGVEVLRQLQTPAPGVSGSIVGILPQAALNYPITAVQSINDYAVNDMPIDVLGFPPLPVGRGAQQWPAGATVLTRDLGNAITLLPPNPLQAIDIILFNHNIALGHDFVVATVLDATQTTHGVEFPPPDVLLQRGPAATLRSWGGNVWGELGDGTVTTHTTPTTPDLPLPVTNVAAGFSSLAVLVDGSVWTFGFAESGVLGRDGTRTCFQYPVFHEDCDPVPRQVLGVSNVVKIASGLLDSYAVDERGELWGWGLSAPGHTFESDSYPRPRKIMSNVTSIAAGYDGAIAVRSDGTVWAWGRNSSGQAGNGASDWLDVPVQVRGPGGVGYLTNIVAATTGRGYAVALANDGAVFAWGDSVGAFGWPDSESPRFPVVVPEVHTARAISTGLDDTLILLGNGTVLAFGSQSLGDGGIGFRGPVPVRGPGGIGVLDDVEYVASGQGFNAVLRRDHTAWVWGPDSLGRLGNGAPLTEEPYPVQVPDLTGVQSLSAGLLHTLATGLLTPTQLGIGVRPGVTSVVDLPENAGSLSFPGDLVPPFISDAIAVTYKAAGQPGHPLGTLRFVNRAFSLDAVDQTNEPLHSFNNAYTITLRYQDRDWQAAGLGSPDQLNLYFWEEDTASWQPVLPCEGCEIDPVAHVVVARLNHMTEFALLGVLPATPPTVDVIGAPTGPIAAGSHILLAAAVTGGLLPYTYSWTRDASFVSGESVLDDVPGLGRHVYSLIVTDGKGLSSEVSRVNVEVVFGGDSPGNPGNPGGGPPGETPELDSILLFGSGALGLLWRIRRGTARVIKR